MKAVLTVISTLLIINSSAQWQDDFSDGDFTTGKIWGGDVDSFEVQNERLWLNAPSNSSISYLSTASDASINGSWEFFVEMDFNPSSTNRAFVYLISNQENLKESLNGYFVMLGNAADEVSLYRQNGSSSTKIIDGEDGILNVSNNKVKVLVNRDALGNWELYADTSANLNNYMLQGTTFDNTHMNSSFFGVRCQYTATRSDKFWFDDFVVTASPFVDTFPPVLENYIIQDLNTVDLFFNESLDLLTAENTATYHISPNIGAPFGVFFNGSFVQLSLNQSLQGFTSYTLQIQNLKDLEGNALDTSFTFSLNDAYSWNSVIINEIYPDENPSYGLPDAEFVELYNLSDDTVYTQGWTFHNDNNSGNFLPDTILPQEYAIICRTSAVEEYSLFGKTIGVASIPALKNAGDQLYIYDKYGTAIDSLYYFNSWYGLIEDENGNRKRDGGYALERINFENPCLDKDNWFPSTAEVGGTPGAINSISGGDFDEERPKILEAFALNDSIVTIQFSKGVNPFEASNPINYFVENNAFEILTIFQNVEDYSIINIAISPKIEEDMLYSIEIMNIDDCFGNLIKDTLIEFSPAVEPEVGDLIINEILFQPFTGGNDFVELYNKTNNWLNLSSIEIVRFNIDNKTQISHRVNIGNASLVMPPHSYFTFTSNVENVQTNYVIENPQWLFEANIPNYPNSDAIAGIVLHDSIVIDKLQYSPRWHFELVNNTRGVSLERINPNFETQDRNNWKSAAEGAGKATPTRINSQFFDAGFSDVSLRVEPTVFTPDGDGYKDFAQIFYQLKETGFVANVSIFDANGREVKKLVANQTIGIEGKWTWDGTNKEGRKAEIGIYIVMADLFSASGKKLLLKEKVVLGANFK